MRNNAIIRRSNPAESQKLTELGTRSKAHWGYSENFMESCLAELNVSPEDIRDHSSEYHVCEINNTIIGYFAVSLITEGEYELEGLFVEPAHIGNGYGRLLIDYAKTLLRQRKAKSLLIQSDPNAKEFYRVIGGTKIGSRESNSIPGRFLPVLEISLVGENTV